MARTDAKLPSRCHEHGASETGEPPALRRDPPENSGFHMRMDAGHTPRL
jgi:hypothetical protein